MFTTTLLTCLAALQPQSKGALMYAPMTLFVDDNTAQESQVPDIGLFKAYGSSWTRPGNHVHVPGQPDFRRNFVPWRHIADRVDAFSTDVNWLALDEGGYASASSASPGWAALLFTVSQTTNGEEGSAIDLERRTGKVGADVFAYTFPDSVGIDRRLIGETVKSFDARDIELADSGSLEPQLEAIDAFVPLFLGEPNVVGPVVATFRAAYVSFEHGTRLPTEWGLGEFDDGQTIYEFGWTPSGGWRQTPRVVVEGYELGLASNEDINALSIDGYHTDEILPRMPKRMAYSVQNSPEVLLVWHDSTRRVLSLPNDKPLTVAAKVDQRPVLNDVVAICSVDPRVPSWTSHMSVPQSTMSGAEPEMFLGVGRSFAGTPGSGLMEIVVHPVPTTAQGTIAVYYQLPWMPARALLLSHSIAAGADSVQAIPVAATAPAGVTVTLTADYLDALGQVTGFATPATMDV